MKCTACGYDNRDGIRFCEECGEPLPLPEQGLTCPECGFTNREEVSFCEECGYAFSAEPDSPPEVLTSTLTCPACGFANRTEVSFCEECGYAFGAVPEPPFAEPVPALTCPSCGFANRDGVSFCEECGYPFEAMPEVFQATVAQACPACGFVNRAEVLFCEECGYQLAALPAAPVFESVAPARPKPATVRPVIPKTRPVRKMMRWVFAGGGVLLALLAVAAIVVFAIPMTRKPVTDFTPILEEMESAAVESAQGYAEQWADWVDPGSGQLEALETEHGLEYMITFEGKPGTGESGFAPRFIVLIDPVTGERTLLEAP